MRGLSGHGSMCISGFRMGAVGICIALFVVFVCNFFLGLRHVSIWCRRGRTEWCAAHRDKASLQREIGGWKEERRFAVFIAAVLAWRQESSPVTEVCQPTPMPPLLPLIPRVPMLPWAHGRAAHYIILFVIVRFTRVLFLLPLEGAEL
jgi:hypothetical protein